MIRPALFLPFLCLLMAAVTPSSAASPRDAVRGWRQAHEHEILTDFTRLLALPNVATSLPDVEANAAATSTLLAARGFRTQRLRTEPGTPPSVFAERLTPGAKRTVVFYAHHD